MLQSGKNTPPEYVEYFLCKTFKWTINELYSQPWDKIDTFLKIINIETQFKNNEQKRTQGKLNNKRPR